METQYFINLYESINIQKHNDISLGTIRKEGRRNVMCKGFHKSKDPNDKNVYAHWQFVLARTMKPYGKSTSFIEKI